MKTTACLVAAFCLVTTAAIAAVETVPREEAQKVILLLNNALGEIDDGPFRLELDAFKPHGLKGDGNAGAVAVPVYDLKSKLTRARPGVIIPVGQLWLHKIVPEVKGQPALTNTLRRINVKTDDAEAVVSLLHLGFRRDGTNHELLVYGQGKSVLLTVPLKSMDVPQSSPIELEVKHPGEGKAELIIYLGDQFEGRISLRQEAVE